MGKMRGEKKMNFTVYLGANEGNDPALKQAVEELGRWIGESGNALVYGGSRSGLMGRLAHSVLTAGGEVTGVEPQFFIDAGVEQQDLTELYVVENMSERKAKMIELGDVFVALPGGVGTLEEISEIMSRIRLHLTPGPCFCLDIDGFYEPLHQLIENMHEHDFIEHWDKDAFQFPKTVEGLIEGLSKWHPDGVFDGRPIVPEKQELLMFG